MQDLRNIPKLSCIGAAVTASHRIAMQVQLAVLILRHALQESLEVPNIVIVRSPATAQATVEGGWVGGWVGACEGLLHPQLRRPLTCEAHIQTQKFQALQHPHHGKASMSEM
jgi:hypothetical protein